LVEADEGSANVTLKANIVSPPSVITWKAIGVGARKATLCGILTSLGGASSVAVSFGWDTVSHTDDPAAYGHWTSPKTMTRPWFFQTRIDNLTPCTKYYFRAKAESGGITSYGWELSFTTPPDKHWWWGWWHWFFGSGGC